MRSKNVVVGLVGIGFAVVASGCEVSPEETVEFEQSWLDDGEMPEAARLTGGGVGGSGERCTEFDGVVTGCEDDEICLPIACTNSIPPFCFGFCQTGFQFP